jgi:hypothetical protein
MRRAKENGWLLGEDGEVIGVNLGSDLCAEHEWGITDLKVILGVPGAKQENRYALERHVDYGGVYGIERRRCKEPDKECIVLKEEGISLAWLLQVSIPLSTFLKSQLTKTMVMNGSFGQTRIW